MLSGLLLKILIFLSYVKINYFVYLSAQSLGITILLTGDAVHTHDALDHRFSPEEYKSNPEYVDTVGKLRKLELDNVKLIFSHE